MGQYHPCVPQEKVYEVELVFTDILAPDEDAARRQAIRDARRAVGSNYRVNAVTCVED